MTSTTRAILNPARPRASDVADTPLVAIILPGFNEELTIEPTIRAFHEAVLEAEMVVINNDSSDASGLDTGADIRALTGSREVGLEPLLHSRMYVPPREGPSPCARKPPDLKSTPSAGSRTDYA
jgi:hypothetical protein